MFPNFPLYKKKKKKKYEKFRGPFDPPLSRTYTEQLLTHNGFL